MDKITANDIRQMKEAYEARRWLNSPEVQAAMLADKRRRQAEWIAEGHLPDCGLLKCKPGCTCKYCA